MKSKENTKLFRGSLLIAVSLFLSQPINYVGSKIVYEWNLQLLLASFLNIFLNLLYSLQIIPFLIGVYILVKKEL